MLLERAVSGSGHAPAGRLSGAVRAVTAGPAPASRRWLRGYQRVLVLGDVLLAAAIAAVVVVAYPGPVSTSDALFWTGASLVPAWPVLLGCTGAYEARLLGAGSEEFHRVGRAGLALLALMGFLSYAAQLELSRAMVVLGIPILALVSVLWRYALRQELHRRRARGRCLKRVVVVGRGGAVLDLARSLGRNRYAGLRVVGACVTPADRGRVAEELGFPVAGLDDVLAVARRTGADTVAVTSASETAAQYLRSLSWELEGSGLELLVAPGLVEVAGPRLHIRPFDGLPLLAVEQPRFEGWPLVVKSALDRVLAAGALVVLLPVFAALAVAVRLSSPGPVFYRQERIGLNGRPFPMIKFRSMVVGADQQVAGLSDGNDADGLLFKMREDPRVTPVGRWLRRLSLDELPQLLNVVRGDMSLVGPRPPLPAEVARYDSSVSRRLLVRPGLTGLWQISGRSDLPWEEAVRLDLRYVENWSLMLDVEILWKTVRAVARSSGAY